MTHAIQRLSGLELDISINRVEELGTNSGWTFTPIIRHGMQLYVTKTRTMMAERMDRSWEILCACGQRSTTAQPRLRDCHIQESVNLWPRRAACWQIPGYTATLRTVRCDRVPTCSYSCFSVYSLSRPHQLGDSFIPASLDLCQNVVEWCLVVKPKWGIDTWLMKYSRLYWIQCFSDVSQFRFQIQSLQSNLIYISAYDYFGNFISNI